MSKYPFLPETLAVRRCNDRIAASYADSSVVAREIFRRLEARLDYLSVKPEVVVDLGCGTAESLSILKRRYRTAMLVGVDLSMNMLLHRKRRGLFSKKHPLLQADAQCLPLKDNSVDILLASMLLPQCGDLESVFLEINRVLKPGGAMLFASLGPDSMKSIMDVMKAVDHRNVRQVFADMHDLGDMMAAAGLAQPVLDVEYLDVSYRSVDAMLSELRACGAVNTVTARRRGLMSPKKYREITDALVESQVVGLSLELVSGHAWKGQQSRSSDISSMSMSMPERYIPIKLV